MSINVPLTNESYYTKAESRRLFSPQSVASWSASLSYTTGQQVTYGGSTFVATQNSTNQMPVIGSNTYWQEVQNTMVTQSELSTEVSTQIASQVASINTQLDLKVDKVTGSSLVPDTKVAKLDGIAVGATANDTDANLRDRATHTGTQSADTITAGLNNAVYTQVEKIKLANLSTTTPPAHTHPTSDIVSGNFDASRIDENATRVFVTPQQKLLINTALQSAQINVANGVAGLDANGKLLTSIIPSFNTIDVFTAASEVAMLGLSNVGIGDQCVRTDLSTNNVFILAQTPSSILTNWVQLNITAGVASVNGRTGIVTLSATDVGLGNVTNESKATMFSSPTFTGIVSGITKDMVGLSNVDNTSDATKWAAIATLTNKTLDDITNYIGANHVHYPVRNSSGVTIPKGTIVKASATQPGTDYIVIVPVSSATDIALGLVHQDIANNGTGLVLNTGLEINLNTSAWAVGTILYPDTSGGLTSIKPTSGQYQACAVVLRQHNTQGSVLCEFSEPKYYATTSREGYVQLNDTLTSTSIAQALTANQGKVLQDGKVDKQLSTTQMALGVNLSAWGAANTLLELQGGSVASLTTSDIRFVENAYYNGTNWVYKANGSATMYVQQNGNHIWYSAPSGTAGATITWSQDMTKTASGRVLIGTATDNGTDKLQINGSINTSAIQTNNMKHFTSAGVGGTTVYDTGISVNAGSNGRMVTINALLQTGAGNATASAILMVRCGYDGNNYTKTVVAFDGGGTGATTANLVVGLSATNTLTITWGIAGNAIYSFDQLN